MHLPVLPLLAPLFLITSLSSLVTGQVLSRPLTCHNDAGDDVPCTCQCAEDPSYKLGSVHPYEVGHAVWCYADESNPGLGEMGPVGCFIEINESAVTRDSVDKYIESYDPVLLLMIWS
ncbi:hypothetical protein NKR19_g4187 [Coniochaeta hoffmannii]|uniref:Uncharacterized protein n=1 Tax=Coniochaeta hoffmannii TaxID=91930 RepID=A0AA38RU59_9PEZI|nr:hypothetical protein NKR19_g4187 [Coniochaeta hoffmannii]